jgi:hypothetical protein
VSHTGIVPARGAGIDLNCGTGVLPVADPRAVTPLSVSWARRAQNFLANFAALAAAVLLAPLPAPAQDEPGRPKRYSDHETSFEVYRDDVALVRRPPGELRAPDRDGQLFDSYTSYVWEPVLVGAGLAPDQAVEVGVDLVFDACNIPGDWYYFAFGDGYYNTDLAECTVRHAYDMPGIYQVTLTVFRDGDWAVLHTCSREVFVRPGMQMLSQMQATNYTFLPVLHAMRGNQAWCVSDRGEFGCADLSNPMALPPMNVFTGIRETAVTSLAVFDTWPSPSANVPVLAVGKGIYGLSLFRALPSSFALLATLTAAQCGAASTVLGVAGVDNTLYVATRYPAQVVVFDVTNPATPRLEYQLPIPADVLEMCQVDTALVLRGTSGRITVVDIRDPRVPVVSDAWRTALATSPVGILSLGRNRIALRHNSAIEALDIGLFGGGDAPRVYARQQINFAVARFASPTPSRLLCRTSGTASKYFVGPDGGGEFAAILAEYGPPAGFSGGTVFSHDPDGADGDEWGDVMFVGIATHGFMAVLP